MANTKVTGDLIASSTIATGNIADNAVTSAKISGITTAHITEGSNLYYTDARARAAVSVSGNALSYNSSTGVITSNFEESPVFTGDVVIGTSTTTPSTHYNNLVIEDVAGNNVGISLISGTGNNTALYFGDSADTDVAQLKYSHATNTMFFVVNASEAMRIDSSGNIGIGASSPQRKLHLHEGSSGGNLISFTNTTTGSSSTNGLLLGLDSSENFLISSYYSGTNIILKTQNSERMRITTGGNVGIGTNSPGFKLEVVKTGADGINVDVGSDFGGIRLTSSTGAWSIRTSTGDDLFFYDVDNTNQAVTFKRGGNVGIGTSSPSAQTHIVGGNDEWTLKVENTNSIPYGLSVNTVGTATTTYNAAFYTHSGTGVYIVNNGKVGIGTASPNYKADIYAEANVGLRIHRPNSALDSTEPIGIGFSTRSDGTTSTTDTRSGLFSYYNGNLFLAANNSDITSNPYAQRKLEITSAGNVVLSANLMPNAENAHNIGSSSLRWEDLYVDDGFIRNAYIDEYIYHNGDTDTYIRALPNEWVLRTGGSDRLTISNSNTYFTNTSVGIGNTTPSSFHNDANNLVVGTGSSMEGITIYSGADSHGGLYFADGTSGSEAYRGFITYNQPSDYFALGTAGSEKIRIASNGVVTFTSGTAIGVEFKTTDSSYGAMNVYKDHTGATRGAVGYNASAIYLGGEANTNTILQAGGQVGLYINNSTRNIGIGTTSPSYKLDVNGTLRMSSSYHQNVNFTNTPTFQIGTDTYSSAFFVYDSTATAYRMVVKSSTGYVGIGTISPSVPLHVYNAAPPGGVGFKTQSGNASNWIQNTTTAGSWQMGVTSSGWQLYNDDTSSIRVTVQNGGNVGIGKTSPNQKLDVAGSISSGAGDKATSVTHDTSGNVRAFVHNFSRNKDTSAASNVTLVDISGLGNFHQAMFFIEYGTRLQSVSDAVTGAVVRTYGVNRFNGGTLQVTETNAIAGSSNSLTHALVNVQIVSNTQYRLRIEFSSTLGASSFATGSIRGYAVGDAFPTITFAEGTAGE